MIEQVRFDAPREGREGPSGIEIYVAARLALGFPAPYVDDVEDAEGAIRLHAYRTTEFAIRRVVPGTPERPAGPSDMIEADEDVEDDRVEQVSLGAFEDVEESGRA